jgi:hypothetical protein
MEREIMSKCIIRGRKLEGRIWMKRSRRGK